jgi:hypothetical protein
MTPVPHTLTVEQLAAVGAAAADHRARTEQLRWAARCEDMEAVLDDLAAGLLPRPDITHVVGYTCEGIDCRYDKGFTPTDYDIFPHLHLDAVLCAAADGSRVLLEGPEVLRVIRGADLEEDCEGIHPDSRGWQVGALYRTVPPAGLDGWSRGCGRSTRCGWTPPRCAPGSPTRRPDRSRATPHTGPVAAFAGRGRYAVWRCWRPGSERGKAETRGPSGEADPGPRCTSGGAAPGGAAAEAGASTAVGGPYRAMSRDLAGRAPVT